MFARISKGLKSFTLLLPSMAFILIYLVSGPRRGSESPIGWSMQSPVEKQKAMPTEAGTQEPDDPQVKAVLDKMAAVGIARPSTVADVRKAYLFYPKLSGNQESVFHVEN